MQFQKIIKNQIEYRFDPLTLEQCRINPKRAKRVKQAESDVELSGIISTSRERCVFCPEQVEVKTPKFPEEISREGRIKRGETIIFPNLNPFGENHAVGIITTEHFFDLDEFKQEALRDNLVASKNYTLSVYESNNEAKFPIYVWNYMPPSAGSIIHPHIQLMVETEPVPELKKLLEKSSEYFRENRSNYWQDLIDQEKKQDERYIGGNDSLSVIATFAPRGFNEIQFIFNEISSLSDLDEKLIDDFVSCLMKVLRGYKEMGVGAFNLATYSGAINEKLDYYRLIVKLISRPFPKGVYTSDTGPMERLYDVWVIDTLPEEVAEKIRAYFV